MIFMESRAKISLNTCECLVNKKKTEQHILVNKIDSKCLKSIHLYPKYLVNRISFNQNWIMKPKHLIIYLNTDYSRLIQYPQSLLPRNVLLARTISTPNYSQPHQLGIMPNSPPIIQIKRVRSIVSNTIPLRRKFKGSPGFVGRGLTVGTSSDSTLLGSGVGLLFVCVDCCNVNNPCTWFWDYRRSE